MDNNFEVVSIKQTREHYSAEFVYTHNVSAKTRKEKERKFVVPSKFLDYNDWCSE